MSLEDELMKFEDRWGDLILSICEEAQLRFRECGAESDFCIQCFGANSIVFGGTNRVYWTPLHAFRLDAEYCTTRFFVKWKIKYGK